MRLAGFSEHEGITRAFERYVTTKFKKYGTLIKSSDAIKQGWFGTGKHHPSFHRRVGDYILVMKEDYILKDYLEGEAVSKHVSHHGGLSENEMLVPLVVAHIQ